MKKGDKVTIDLTKLIKERGKNEGIISDMFNKAGLNTSTFNTFLSSNDNIENIKKRVNSNMTATITKVVDDNYVNLEFKDGFKCGTQISHLIKI